MATRTLPTLAPSIPPRRIGVRCGDPDARPSRSMAEAERMTGDLEILAHPIRLQLLDVLVRKAGEVCVSDLEASVPVKQPTVSHHLKLLREAGLVSCDRQGLFAYYRVNRDVLDALRFRIGDTLAALG